jgi:hypothetical protein
MLSSLFSETLNINTYKTRILPVIFHVCDTWSLALREVNKLQVPENKVLRKIYIPETDEANAEFRVLNKGFCDLYRSPRSVRIIKSRRLLQT